MTETEKRTMFEQIRAIALETIEKSGLDKAIESLERAKEIRRNNDSTGMLDYRSQEKCYRAHELAKQISNRISQNKVNEKPLCLDCILDNLCLQHFDYKGVN